MIFFPLSLSIHLSHFLLLSLSLYLHHTFYFILSPPPLSRSPSIHPTLCLFQFLSPSHSLPPSLPLFLSTPPSPSPLSVTSFLPPHPTTITHPNPIPFALSLSPSVPFSLSVSLSLPLPLFPLSHSLTVHLYRIDLHLYPSHNV